MRIEWMGHSCFALETEGGVRIVTDPFDAEVGYPMPWGRADIVTVSHNHHDHNHVQPLNPSHVADEAREYQFGAVHIQGIASFHDGQSGAKRGGNVIFVVEADGVRVAHLGDLGHQLSARQRTLLGPVDILMVPVGGFYTIDGVQAAEECRAIAPRVVLPMHYRNQWIDFPISDEKHFLQALGATYERRDCLDTSFRDAAPVVLLNLSRE